MISLILLFCLVVTSSLVILSRNPVVSVLNLCVLFLIAALIIFDLNFNFLAFVYIIVYMGAVIVLFLFVVMMLQITEYKNQTNQNILAYRLLTGFVVIVFLVELFLFKELHGLTSPSISSTITSLLNNSDQSILIFGNLFYTYYSLYFILAALVLLVALIGAIILSLPQAAPTTRDNISVSKRFFVKLKQLS